MRSASEKPTSANFDATYAARKGLARFPTTEATLTMWPAPWRRMCGSAASTPWTAPR